MNTPLQQSLKLWDLRVSGREIQVLGMCNCFKVFDQFAFLSAILILSHIHCTLYFHYSEMLCEVGKIWMDWYCPCFFFCYCIISVKIWVGFAIYFFGAAVIDLGHCVWQSVVMVLYFALVGKLFHKCCCTILFEPYCIALHKLIFVMALAIWTCHGASYVV